MENVELLRMPLPGPWAHRVADTIQYREAL